MSTDSEQPDWLRGEQGEGPLLKVDHRAVDRAQRAVDGLIGAGLAVHTSCVVEVLGDGLIPANLVPRMSALSASTNSCVSVRTRLAAIVLLRSVAVSVGGTQMSSQILRNSASLSVSLINPGPGRSDQAGDRAVAGVVVQDGDVDVEFVYASDQQCGRQLHGHEDVGAAAHRPGGVEEGAGFVGHGLQVLDQGLVLERGVRVADDAGVASGPADALLDAPRRR